MVDARLEQLTAADLPRQFDRYELQSILGTGGMARVFGAELHGPAGFRKPVAIKIIKPEMVGQTDTGETAAFIREARLGGLLKHPNIVDVYELGESEGRLFIAMEWVQGMTLNQIISGGFCPPASVALDIVDGIVSGLVSAHALRTDGVKAGLVHRDLKPSNVLVSWDGAVKIVDFGIATTQRGELAVSGQAFSEGRGTITYMAPEQLLGERVDMRSDLFSLGLVAIELVTMKWLPRKQLYDRLLAGQSRHDPVVSESTLQSVDSAVPGLGRILQCCLAPLPESRFDSARTLLDQIRTLRETVVGSMRLAEWLANTFCSETTQSNRLETRPQLDNQNFPTARLDSLPDDVPSISTSRSNLGPRLDQYVGRDSELDALDRIFSSGPALVTIKGTGGAGKTRFARRYGRSQLDVLEGGVWFVDLTEARTPKGLVHATAMALDVPLGGDDFDGMVTQVGHAIAGRGSVLLIFDNFEQVVSHAADTLGLWRAAAPEANFLVTSRESLRLLGEQIFHLEALSEQEGVELFGIRSRALGANWLETPENLAAITEVVQRLDGLPLAIELAAARTLILSPTQLSERLSQRFQLLRQARQDTTDRQASLRGLIDWSWELLESWERSALAQLSVFRDGFFMEAAEAVLDLSSWPDAPWSLDVVGSLLNKSLLRSRMVENQPRFGMYVSIQAYAAEKLGESSRAVARRHAIYYSSLGSETHIASLCTHGGLKRRRALVLELENLLAGVDTALAMDEPEVAAACALSTAQVFLMLGPFQDGFGLTQRIMAQSIGPETRIRVLQTGFEYLIALGRHSEATEYGEQALNLAKESGNRGLEGITLGHLAGLHIRLGNTELGMEYSQEALAISRELRDRVQEPRILNRLAWTEMGQGKYAEAMKRQKQALSIAQETGNRQSESMAYHVLGRLERYRGNLQASAEAYLEALAIDHELGDRRTVGLHMRALGKNLHVQGRMSESKEYYQQSLVLARDVGSRLSEGTTLGLLAILNYDEGDLELAAERFREAIVICDEVWERGAGFFRGNLSLIHARKGEFSEARSMVLKGEAQVGLGERSERGSYLGLKAELEYRVGDMAAAAETLAQAEAIAAELDLGPNSELNTSLKKVRSVFSGSMD